MRSIFLDMPSDDLPVSLCERRQYMIEECPT